jgi:type I restriction enzyme, R subunit
MAPPPDEKTYVEIPFIEQLIGLGWEYIEGDIDVPYLTERESFREVLLRNRLRKALMEINRDDEGRRWLEEETEEGTYCFDYIYKYGRHPR